jgi:hypothetical protein
MKSEQDNSGSPIPQPVSGRQPDLRTIYCQVRHCPPERFKDQILRKTVHRRALPLLPLIRLVWPGFFAPDYDLIEDAGSAARLNEILSVINGFRNDCEREKRFFHDQLRLRISGRRFYQVFARAREEYLRNRHVPHESSPSPRA